MYKLRIVCEEISIERRKKYLSESDDVGKLSI